jgi:predicted ribosomally synthesized peptide with SipW-like signal peptide
MRIKIFQKISNGVNTRIFVSLSIIVIVGAAAIGGTLAYFNDIETSIGNTFAAGEIDLKIDFHCKIPTGCGWSLRDLHGEHFFSECDVKPGDSKEGTISFHVYNNNAWGRIRLTDVYNYENSCSEPESAYPDLTCGDPGDGEGELDDYLTFSIWLDQGGIAGWQCSELSAPNNVAGCPADPLEGDNTKNGIETFLVENMPVSQFVAGGWYVFPQEIQASSTYYVGVQWSLPWATGNIVQTDSLMGSVIMEVVQSQGNPWPPTF